MTFADDTYVLNFKTILTILFNVKLSFSLISTPISC
jgi:hypothetical protein